MDGSHLGAISHPCVVALPPVLLRDAVGDAPAEWQPVVAALLATARQWG